MQALKEIQFGLLPQPTQRPWLADMLVTTLNNFRGQQRYPKPSRVSIASSTKGSLGRLFLKGSEINRSFEVFRHIRAIMV